MLMDWGVKKADELALECFLDSSPMAVKIYESFGFLVADQIIFDTTVENPSEEWKELEAKYPLIPLYVFLIHFASRSKWLTNVQVLICGDQ